MYKDCKVHVQIRKEKRTIDYLTWVQQGYNVTPVLFIYLMLAVSKTVKKNWKYKAPAFGHFKFNKKWNRSRWLKNQNYWTKGDLLEMCHLLFVDESTFLFESLQDMEIGSQTIHDHYARFVLVMHVGRGDKKSKIEAMHAPAKLNQKPIAEGTRI
jgi:hypothetical protein